jgi:hypothetical protein
MDSDAGGLLTCPDIPLARRGPISKASVREGGDGLHSLPLLRRVQSSGADGQPLFFGDVAICYHGASNRAVRWASPRLP